MICLTPHKKVLKMLHFEYHPGESARGARQRGPRPEDQIRGRASWSHEAGEALKKVKNKPSTGGKKRTSSTKSKPKPKVARKALKVKAKAGAKKVKATKVKPPKVKARAAKVKATKAKGKPAKDKARSVAAKAVGSKKRHKEFAKRPVLRAPVPSPLPQQHVASPQPTIVAPARSMPPREEVIIPFAPPRQAMVLPTDFEAGGDRKSVV